MRAPQPRRGSAGARCTALSACADDADDADDAERDDADLCIFQVDLFSARAKMPTSIWDIEARTKDIRVSSRTRLNTESQPNRHSKREGDKRLHDKLPAELRDDPDARTLLSQCT